MVRYDGRMSWRGWDGISVSRNKLPRLLNAREGVSTVFICLCVWMHFFGVFGRFYTAEFWVMAI